MDKKMLSYCMNYKPILARKKLVLVYYLFWPVLEGAIIFSMMTRKRRRITNVNNIITETKVKKRQEKLNIKWHKTITTKNELYSLILKDTFVCKL